jgi:hypothetical protein
MTYLHQTEVNMQQHAIPASDPNEEQRRREQIRRNQAVIDLLNSWEEEDEEEQRETWEFLKRALDEDRPSHRKLFP